MPEKRFLMDNIGLKHTNLIISEKKRLTLDGVENIESFDEATVNLATVAGKICVEGSNLKIESLSKDKGEICIVGSINGVYYSEIKKLPTFFERLFG